MVGTIGASRRTLPQPMPCSPGFFSHALPCSQLHDDLSIFLGNRAKAKAFAAISMVDYRFRIQRVFSEPVRTFPTDVLAASYPELIL